MPLADEDMSAFPRLGFLIDGEMFTETPGSSFDHCCLATDRLAHYVPMTLANAVWGGFRSNIVRAWPGLELDYSTGDPQVAVAPLIEYL
jgi:hypothetical protein